MKNKKTKIIAIVGPTASGKSSLALEIAKRNKGEIISCDSMQIYKRMNIGTAKPTADELAAVRHHLIDIIEPTESFSSEDYVQYATAAIEDCVSRKKLPIICGGTGLYLDALLRGGNAAPSVGDPEIREKLKARVRRKGISVLYEELRVVDPESAAIIHPNNEHRIIRALEIYYACGKTKSELDKLSQSFESPYDATVICLSYFDRELLYWRIEQRVDLMLADGLLEETEALMKEGIFEQNGTAAQAIGYKELLGYLDGTRTLEEAIDDLKTATRRYAKRQLTWFRAKSYVTPLYADTELGMRDFGTMLKEAESYL